MIDLEPLVNGFYFLLWASIIMLPLALWKTIEIIIWIINHVHIDL